MEVCSSIPKKLGWDTPKTATVTNISGIAPIATFPPFVKEIHSEATVLRCIMRDAITSPWNKISTIPEQSYHISNAISVMTDRRSTPGLTIEATFASTWNTSPHLWFLLSFQTQRLKDIPSLLLSYHALYCDYSKGWPLARTRTLTSNESMYWMTSKSRNIPTGYCSTLVR